MSHIMIQSELTKTEQSSLENEFPSCSIQVGGEPKWKEIEIMLGENLSCEQLKQAPNLRWIHSPQAQTDQLCLGDLWQKGSVIVTNTKGQNVEQIGEFVTGCILSFAKNFCHWHKHRHNAPTFPMWKLKGKRLLQIGLGLYGSEIAKRAKQMGVKVWGVRRQPSFHPHCEKVFGERDIHSLLPATDIVCLNLPRGKHYTTVFGKDEFELMKEGSLFLTLGGFDALSEAAVVEVAKKQKLRGIAIDFSHHRPPPKQSPLWTTPNVLLTPGISGEPYSDSTLPFQTFRYNLRQFLHGNHDDMRNIVEPTNEF